MKVTVVDGDGNPVISDGSAMLTMSMKMTDGNKVLVDKPGLDTVRIIEGNEVAHKFSVYKILYMYQDADPNTEITFTAEASGKGYRGGVIFKEPFSEYQEQTIYLLKEIKTGRLSVSVIPGKGTAVSDFNFSNVVLYCQGLTHSLNANELAYFKQMNYKFDFGQVKLGSCSMSGSGAYIDKTTGAPVQVGFYRTFEVTKEINQVFVEAYKGTTIKISYFDSTKKLISDPNSIMWKDICTEDTNKKVTSCSAINKTLAQQGFKNPFVSSGYSGTLEQLNQILATKYTMRTSYKGKDVNTVFNAIQGVINFNVTFPIS